MNHLKAPFVLVDRLIQRAVIWLSIWLLRRGVPKSRQTYTLSTIWSSSMVASIFLSMFRNDLPLWATFLVLIAFGFISFVDLMTYRIDVVAEERGMQTLRDRPLLGETGWKLFALGAIVMNWYDGGNRDNDLILTFGWSANIALLYHRHAPRQPPPKKQESPVFNVPATEGA